MHRNPPTDAYLMQINCVSIFLIFYNRILQLQRTSIWNYMIIHIQNEYFNDKITLWIIYEKNIHFVCISQCCTETRGILPTRASSSSNPRTGMERWRRPFLLHPRHTDGGYENTNPVCRIRDLRPDGIYRGSNNNRQGIAAKCMACRSWCSARRTAPDEIRMGPSVTATLQER